MHIRTFKAQAAKLFQKANPDWQIVDSKIGPLRGKIPARPMDYSDGEREMINWFVEIQRGNHRRTVWLTWAYRTGFDMKGGY